MLILAKFVLTTDEIIPVCLMPSWLTVKYYQFINVLYAKNYRHRKYLGINIDNDSMFVLGSLLRKIKEKFKLNRPKLSNVYPKRYRRIKH